MAITGLSIPIVTDYFEQGNKVGYANPMVAAKAISYSLTPNKTDDNPLYADNGIAENESGIFVDGDIEIGVDNLSQEMSKKILGIKTVQRTVGEKTYEELVFDDDMRTPYLGFGIIEEHIINGVKYFKPNFLTKVKFDMTEDSVTTRGSSIEWQTPTIKGKFYRSARSDNNYNKPWKYCTMCDTESEAVDYLMAVGAEDPDNIAKGVETQNAVQSSEAKSIAAKSSKTNEESI